MSVAALEEIQSWNCKDSLSGAFLLLNGICQSTFIISLLCSEKLLAYTLPIKSEVLKILSEKGPRKLKF
ncbi:unnamed protein product [Macrosiphum euphorbiae]|uniref:Uncharacterized protein n=1 Tax=Macrosiphum euphorbiae TaxID=13131 RepID=A0AAV0W919_9HEMI|nr:unnamed protein product [Macrosiphum euphorbiae]